MFNLEKKESDDKVNGPREVKEKCKENRVTKAFVNALAILSILGFVGIVSRTLFDNNIENYIESVWFLIMGIGFIFESSPINLFLRVRNGMGEKDFASLTTLIVGVLAIVAGAFSLPYFGFVNPGFYAIQGIISIIAIIFIAVQTWVIK
jgi:hypothetical protein